MRRSRRLQEAPLVDDGGTTQTQSNHSTTGTDQQAHTVRRIKLVNRPVLRLRLPFPGLAVAVDSVSGDACKENAAVNTLSDDTFHGTGTEKKRRQGKRVERDTFGAKKVGKESDGCARIATATVSASGGNMGKMKRANTHHKHHNHHTQIVFCHECGKAARPTRPILTCTRPHCRLSFHADCLLLPFPRPPHPVSGATGTQKVRRPKWSCPCHVDACADAAFPTKFDVNRMPDQPVTLLRKCKFAGGGWVEERTAAVVPEQVVEYYRRVLYHSVPATL